MKFTKQWERALAKHKVGRGGEKPVGKTSPVAPTEPQVSDKVYSETENALNRWVNKAENIYKAWSTKNPARRDTPSAIRLIEELPAVETQTYIITVEDNHNFYANNILVHNK